MTWTAISESGELIKSGQLVEIKKVDGNKLIVIPVSQDTEKSSGKELEEQSAENKAEKSDEDTSIQTEQQIQKSEKTEEGKK